MDKIQLDKEHTRKLIVSLAPQYAEMLRDLELPTRWAKVSRKFESYLQAAAADSYVTVYDDENRIHKCLWLALCGEAGHKELNDELVAMSREEQQAWFDDLMAEANEEDAWSWIEEMFPDTPAKEEAARLKFEALTDEEKKEAGKRATYWWFFFLCSFYNYLSLMLHGFKLTVLVARAKAGDPDAFCKAIHVEPRLLRHHSYFRDRYLLAQEDGETAFLKRIGYRLAHSGLKGSIRYPGLNMVFAMLEAAGWLDGGFTHEQILDVCDKAELDRFENRIEDTNYLTKRLGEYRARQKLSDLSML
jgi:hypothetical protein